MKKIKLQVIINLNTALIRLFPWDLKKGPKMDK